MPIHKRLLSIFIIQLIVLLVPPTTLAAEQEWIVIENQNFQVLSAAGERKTREALNQFERVRSFFSQVTNAKSLDPTPVSVVIFRSERQYKPFRPNDVAAAYYSNFTDRDFIVIGELNEASSQFASHEYTHLVLNRAGYTLPPWLNEGLAEFFSTLSPAGEAVEFGGLLPGHLYALGSEPWVPLHIILAADQKSPYYNETKKAGSLYSQSWALVHMLYNSEKYKNKFWQVVDAVNAGMPSVQALTKAYDVPFVKIENDLKSYVGGNRFLVQRAKLNLDETTNLTSRPAEMTEVRAVQAMLLIGLPGKQAEARKQFEALTMESPKRAELWSSFGYLAWQEGKQDEAIGYFAKAVELGGSNRKLLMNYAQLTAPKDSEAARTALIKLLKIEPDNIDARLLLAQILMEEDQISEAVAATRSIRTVKTPKQRDHLLYLRAYAALRLGYYKEARTLAEELKELSDSMDFRMYATQILRALERVEPNSTKALNPT